MLTTTPRHGLLTSALKLVPALAIAGAATLMVPEDVQAQSFNVKDFSCTADGSGVRVDIRGCFHNYHRLTRALLSLGGGPATPMSDPQIWRRAWTAEPWT